jgi:replication factor A1
MVSGLSSNWMTLKEAQENQLGCGEKPDYFTSVATVLMVRSENSLYKACPTAECNKKVGYFHHNVMYTVCRQCRHTTIIRRGECDM